MNFMTWFYETPLTILLAILALVIVLLAQAKINRAYRKYKSIENKKNLSGAEAAKMILDANGLSDIYVVETRGELTDHYDPSRKVIRLSKHIFHGTTIAAVSVAAHEVGHAIQDKEGYALMKIRHMLIPFVNLVSYLGYFGLIISIFAGITGYIYLSILVLCATLLFQLVTLPVEFDASKRACVQLETLNIVDSEEIIGAKNMLKAAAMTYVASLASTIINILRLLIMAQDRD